LLFFAFFGLFSGDLGFSIAIHIRIHHHFSRFFRVFASGPCTVVGGLLLAKFFTLTQSPSYTNDYSYAKDECKQEDIFKCPQRIFHFSWKKWTCTSKRGRMV